MATATLICDQAIFTSIRTPMGEGYRIIAASSGVRPDEKKAITQCSPSHNALCTPASEGGSGRVIGAAFYPLPTGRLCVAASCYAGAEHTGRGGQRVYTHNVILEQSAFPTCAYNPFQVIRAMMRAGMTAPQLKPPSQLGELRLSLAASADAPELIRLDPTLSSACRRHVLKRLLYGSSLVVALEGGWLESTEAWLMGVPGPLRADLSFCAGLRYSAGRRHRLQLLGKEGASLKQKVAGQPIEYVNPAAFDHASVATCGESAWLTFADDLWSHDDTRTLANRTSRSFTDTGPEALESLGQLYRAIDEIPELDTTALLGRVRDRLGDRAARVEREIVAEFVTAAQASLVARFEDATWATVAPHWSTLLSVWRDSHEGTSFAHPLIARALRHAMNDHPLIAAETALEIAQGIPLGAHKLGHAALLDEILAHLANWAERATEADVETLLRMCDRWQLIRPQDPILERIRRRCERARGLSPRGVSAG